MLANRLTRKRAISAPPVVVSASPADPSARMMRRPVTKTTEPRIHPRRFSQGRMDFRAPLTQRGYFHGGSCTKLVGGRPARPHRHPVWLSGPLLAGDHSLRPGLPVRRLCPGRWSLFDRGRLPRRRASHPLVDPPLSRSRRHRGRLDDLLLSRHHRHRLALHHRSLSHRPWDHGNHSRLPVAPRNHQ